VNSLILRLAGPLQSWGEHSTFSLRDTTAFPTRSGLIGLFCAVQGHGRNHDLEDYRDLEIAVRVDRPGRRLVDFHTVGGGNPRSRTVLTAEGKRRQEGATTVVSHRHYLADAVFTVAVSARSDPARETLGRLAEALEQPAWAPYLGRRSCVPDQPMLLRTNIEDVLTELRERTPIPSVRAASAEIRTAEFIHERSPDDGRQDAVYELMDVPESFAALDRRYTTRRVYRTTQTVTAPQYGPGGYDQLIRYVREGHE
jgi:CRISPR system Cascade subunit CasD